MGLFRFIIKADVHSDDIIYFLRVQEHSDFTQLSENELYNMIDHSMIDESLRLELSHGTKKEQVSIPEYGGWLTVYNIFSNLLKVYYYILYKIQNPVFPYSNIEEGKEHIKKAKKELEDRLHRVIDYVKSNAKQLNNNYIDTKEENEEADDDIRVWDITDEELFEGSEVPNYDKYIENVDKTSEFFKSKTDKMINFLIEHKNEMIEPENRSKFYSYIHTIFRSYFTILNIARSYSNDISLVWNKVNKLCAELREKLEQDTLTVEEFYNLFYKVIDDIVREIYIKKIEDYRKPKSQQGHNVSNITFINSNNSLAGEYLNALNYNYTNAYTPNLFKQVLNVVIENIKTQQVSVLSEILNIKKQIKRKDLKTSSIVIPNTLKNFLELNCLQFLKPIDKFFNNILSAVKLVTNERSEYNDVCEELAYYILEFKENIQYIRKVVNSADNTYVDVAILDKIARNYVESIKNARIILQLNNAFIARIKDNKIGYTNIMEDTGKIKSEDVINLRELFK